MLKISVIIPAYKEKPEILKKCVYSVLSQTYKNFKIYLILDINSSKEIKGISKELSKNKKIIIIKDLKKGSASHRNLGVKNSWNYADYFAFTDADCIADKNWLKELVKVIKKQPKDIGCVGGINISNEKNLISQAIFCAESSFMGGGGISGQTTIQKKEKFVNSIPNCNALYRKECWIKDKQDEQFIKGQDAEFNLRLAKEGWRFLQTPKAVIYHKREDSIIKYAKKMYNYGKAAMKIIKKQGFYGLKRFWYGVGITGYYLVLIALFILTLFYSFLWPIFFIYLGVYFIGLVFSILFKIRIKNIVIYLTSIFILIIQHTFYVVGFLAGFIYG